MNYSYTKKIVLFIAGFSVLSYCLKSGDVGQDRSAIETALVYSSHLVDAQSPTESTENFNFR